MQAGLARQSYGASRGQDFGLYARFGKRAFDLCLVVLTMPIWLPLIGVLCGFPRWSWRSSVWMFENSNDGDRDPSAMRGT